MVSINVVCLVSVLVLIGNSQKYKLELPNKDAHDLFKEYNVEYETHKVQTPDGYIVQMFRIFGGVNAKPKLKEAPPILIQPSQYANVNIILLEGPEKSPPIFLANEGFDVWLLSSRGSLFGLEHTTLDPENDQEFWDIDLYDYTIDIKAMVEYVLDHTKSEKVSFITHSESGITIAMAFSENVEWYRDRIHLNVFLAPITPFMVVPESYSSKVNANIEEGYVSSDFERPSFQKGVAGTEMDEDLFAALLVPIHQAQGVNFNYKMDPAIDRLDVGIRMTQDFLPAI